MVDRPVLRIGDRVRFEGAEHQVVALSGNAVRLLSTANEASVVLAPYLQAAPDFAVLGGGDQGDGRVARVPPLGLLATLPEQVLTAAREWERHLVEVETGLPLGAPEGTQPRPEYDPVLHSLVERERAKAEELCRAGTKASVRTVRRMRARYRDQGLWGLVDTRYARRAKPTGNVDARVVEAAARVIDAQTSTSTGTKGRVISQIKQGLEEEYGPGTVPLPGKTTFYKLVDVLAAGKHTFGSATTRRQMANRPEGAFTATTASRPGEQVQMDGTLLDVMAVMDDGVIGRPELVAAVDVATRTICAAVLRPVGAKAVDAALLLARMMTPEPMRPGWDEALAMKASRIPHQRLVSIDTRLELAAAKPVIAADTVVIDHGRVFVSEVFLRACDTLGISVQPAHQQTGTDKAIMERTFESINTLFCQHVAGYTGRDVTHRGADVDERAVWSLPDLQEQLDEWVVAGWQSRPHEGLRHPFTPDQPASPNDAYAALVTAAGYIPIALSGEDYIELLPAEWRAIGDGGVQINYRTYTCPELRAYSHYPSPITAKGGRWEVHYDPYDVTRVWIRNHYRGGWIMAPWRHASLVAQPFADFTWRHARKIAAQRGVDATNETAVAVVLAALLRRAGQGPDPTERALARTRAAAAVRNHLPPDLLPTLTASTIAADEITEQADAESVTTAESSAAGHPANRKARRARAAQMTDRDADESDEDEPLQGTVVGFGLFDPFADDQEGLAR
ncbi:Mu transposase C-terminal domain-containing protein [Streptosporangium sp. NPDC006013]|uniref:Mu transposase C-terminal domain-containing protein n=1 Tax=Streptosporangium sp. NPDC006013 TaxID=3155596 RepID=UPI0033B510B7